MKAFLILCSSFLLYTPICVSQESTSDATQNEKIYTRADEMPVYEGGMKKFYRYLSENIEYPDYARQNKIQSRVYVEFVVDEKGIVDDKTVNVVKSVHESLDNEALRLIKGADKWEPGYESDINKNVKVRMVVPITFRLGRR